MRRTLIFAGAVLGLAVAVPAIVENNPQLLAAVLGQGDEDGKGVRGGEPPAASETVAAVSVRDATPAALSGRRVRIPADARGHFNADFRINGRAVPALIDTGATVVALNASTARRIGIVPAASDYTATVQTANGPARAAVVTIDRLELGRIDVADVQAVVLDDKALSGTLVGMSFLSRLRRYQVEGAELTLEQ